MYLYLLYTKWIWDIFKDSPDKFDVNLSNDDLLIVSDIPKSPSVNFIRVSKSGIPTMSKDSPGDKLNLAI